MVNNIEDLGKEVSELKKAAIDNKEATGNFKEWVSGGLELVKPWKQALVITNICWAVVVSLLVCLAWLSPSTYTYEQNQDLAASSQSASGGGSN